MIARGVLLAAMLTAGAAWAEPPGGGFSPPLACVQGETCWIVNYADTEPGPAARDFRCGDGTYDAHSGTDFAVRDLAAMRSGVPVLAAADGTVLRGRNTEADGTFTRDGADSNRACGNGLVLSHGDGWETWYCHMRAGSVAAPGTVVKRGETIGLVGLSGMTQFPHVHIETRRDGTVLDPFTGADLKAGCGVKGEPLWRAADKVAYQDVSLYAVGFADHPPTSEELQNDAASPRHLSAKAGALVLWTQVFGPDSGDVLRLSITGPDGAEVLAKDVAVTRNQARRMDFSGRKTPPGGWPPGVYRGTATLTRGTVVQTRTVTVEVR